MKTSLFVSAFADRTDPVDPNAPTDANAPPILNREERRSVRLKVWVWGKQFGSRLKANALRMKQFLHGRS